MDTVDRTSTSKQETFDRVVAHLRQQGCKSISPDGVCMYRGPNGTKCAAGCLIPDTKYSSSMENSTVWGTPGVILYGEGHDLDLVRGLQIVHDSYCVPEWENKLAGLAKRLGLSYTHPDGGGYSTLKD
jgi:hypothetical protein